MNNLLRIDIIVEIQTGVDARRNLSIPYNVVLQIAVVRLRL